MSFVIAFVTEVAAVNIGLEGTLFMYIISKYVFATIACNAAQCYK